MLLIRNYSERMLDSSNKINYALQNAIENYANTNCQFMHLSKNVIIEYSYNTK